MSPKGHSASGLVTRQELAALLDVNPRTVAKFLDEGMPVAKRGRGGRSSLYSPEACLAWLEARNAVASDAPVDLARERARKERAQALLAEQTYAVRAGKLLPAEQVEQVWSAEQAAVRAKLLALPQAYADRLARAVITGGVSAAEQAIRQMVDEVLTELATQPQRAGRNGQSAA